MSRAATDPIQTLRELFDSHGSMAYGERVNQIQHALQCGALAERSGARPELITAAFLHDIGHMLHRNPAGALAAHVDDRHEYLGAKFIARWFVEGIADAVALHVDAKRYLCAREPGYLKSLSDVSMTTLGIQGGPMSAEQADRFESRPGFTDAVSLRRWDEQGKDPSGSTPDLAHFLNVATACLARP